MDKHLYRSRNDRIISGVCSGLGTYFGIDPTVVRVIAALLLLVSFGTMILIYLVLALVIPLEPMQQPAVRPEPGEIQK
jgi:phage shock protein C